VLNNEARFTILALINFMLLATFNFHGFRVKLVEQRQFQMIWLMNIPPTATND